MTQTKLPKAVEDEFDKEFPSLEWTRIVEKYDSKKIPNELCRQLIENDKGWNINTEPWRLKQFIAQALQTQTEEYRKRIEEMPENCKWFDGKKEQQGLVKSDVLNILKETNKEL